MKTQHFQNAKADYLLQNDISQTPTHDIYGSILCSISPTQKVFYMPSLGAQSSHKGGRNESSLSIPHGPYRAEAPKGQKELPQSLAPKVVERRILIPLVV